MANFSIVTNIGALNAQNQLTKTSQGMQNTIARLSSGLRINGAKDDAAGLAIANNLNADVQALNQAVRNANDGIGVINTADAALNETGNLLQRAVTLAEQASSGTSGVDSGTAKTAMNQEYQQILAEIDRIGNTVTFNGQNLLNAASSSVDVQVGTGNTSNDRVTINLTPSGNGLTATGLGLTTGSATTALQTASGAQAELVKVKSAIDKVSSMRGTIGAAYNRLEHTISVITVQAENLNSAQSQIRDANVAEEVVNLTKYQVLNQTGLSALAQANSSSQSVLSLLR
ncbi:MAG TPA: flagellin [Acidobacteriota bacterium]|nr:flagellin [Acidobacteriota bacterium]